MDFKGATKLRDTPGIKYDPRVCSTFDVVSTHLWCALKVLHIWCKSQANQRYLCTSESNIWQHFYIAFSNVSNTSQSVLWGFQNPSEIVARIFTPPWNTMTSIWNNFYFCIVKMVSVNRGFRIIIKVIFRYCYVCCYQTEKPENNLNYR